MPNIKKQSRKKYHIIYQTTNILNNMIYIGAHSTDLLEDDYIGSGHALRLAIKKYGIESFKRTILYIFDSPDKMFKKESEIVNADFIKRSDVYNIVEGGFGGYNKGSRGLKHLYHPISGERCAVNLEAVDKMISEGWILGFPKSWQEGKIYVHKNNKKKVIESSQLDQFLAEGWKKGLPKSPTSEKIWIYHTDLKEYKLCDKNDLKNKLKDGWIKKKWAPIKKGSCWVNNGEKNLRIEKNVLDDYLKSGWNKGIITLRWKN